jgi:chromosome segregation protein
MYLRRLEIQGFKTFAGHTLFEFQPGITAVVGPNAAEVESCRCHPLGAG